MKDLGLGIDSSCVSREYGLIKAILEAICTSHGYPKAGSMTSRNRTQRNRDRRTSKGILLSNPPCKQLESVKS